MNIQVLGLDHIYFSVSDMVRSEQFYDAVMAVLGFRKNSFDNEGERHVQYFNRHFGLVLRPAAWWCAQSTGARAASSLLSRRELQ